MNEILDETEVAALLDCEPSTIQEKARCGELPAVKFGRSWRFPRTALLDALNRRAAANTPERAIRAIAKPISIKLPPALPKT